MVSRSHKPLTIGVYQPWIYLMGGAERVLERFARYSRHNITILTNHYQPHRTFPEFGDYDVVELPHISAKRTVRDTVRSLYTLVTQDVDLRPYDALMVSAASVGHWVTMGPMRSIPCFAYCHTPLRIAYDDLLRREEFIPNATVAQRVGVQLFRSVDRWTWSRFDRVFCNSRETRRRLEQYQLVGQDDLEVLYPGVESVERSFTKPDRPYVLLPGRIARSKNIELAIDAFTELTRDGSVDPELQLIIAGMVDEKSRPYFDALVQRAHGNERIRFVVDASDKQMSKLYAECTVALSTALNEDFGLTVLEGMAHAKPVIAVNEGGPTESILHNRTGLLASPKPRAFSDAIRHVLDDSDRSARMGEAGRLRAADFHWAPFAARIDDYAESLVRRSSRS